MNRFVDRGFLDNMPCAHPGCERPLGEQMFLNAGCHPGAPVRASYHRGTGVLELRCAICDMLVAPIAVKPSAAVDEA